MSMDLDIVAIGARTPVGSRAETSAAAVRAGISRLREYPYVTPRGEPLTAATDPGIDETLTGPDRLIAMLDGVLDEILRKLADLDLRHGSVDVHLALPETRPGFSDRDAERVTNQIASRLRAEQVRARVAIGGRGHAGALACIEGIAALGGRGPSSMHVVLAVDSYLEIATLGWLESQRLLLGPGVINGIEPGEAAGALVLTNAATRRQTGLPCLARIDGVGTAREARLRDSDTGSLGEGLGEAVRRASAGLSLPAEAVDAVVCDLNRERYRSEEWGLVAMRCHAAMRTLVYEAPSASWGEVGAAFGALGAVLAVESFTRGRAPGPRAMVMAGSLSGLRGAMVLRAPEGWAPR